MGQCARRSVIKCATLARSVGVFNPSEGFIATSNDGVSDITRGRLMKPRLIVAISVIAGLSLCAEAQEPSAAKADAQKFVKMIIGDKAKSQIYCDVVKL